MYLLIDKLVATHPWLKQCTNSFDVTDFMAESDALDYISHTAPTVSTTTDMTDTGLLA
jgi:hypothetical protein